MKFLLLTMLFLHFVTDFHFQGSLAQYKQKSWWNKHTKDPMYDKDFIAGLIAHSFIWTFVVFVPLMFFYRFDLDLKFALFFIGNFLFHILVDHLKANIKVIGLLSDQTFHICQIVITFIFLTRV